MSTPHTSECKSCGPSVCVLFPSHGLSLGVGVGVPVAATPPPLSSAQDPSGLPQRSGGPGPPLTERTCVPALPAVGPLDAQRPRPRGWLFLRSLVGGRLTPFLLCFLLSLFCFTICTNS